MGDRWKEGRRRERKREGRREGRREERGREGGKEGGKEGEGKSQCEYFLAFGSSCLSGSNTDSCLDS